MLDLGKAQSLEKICVFRASDTNTDTGNAAQRDQSSSNSPTESKRRSLAVWVECNPSEGLILQLDIVQGQELLRRILFAKERLTILLADLLAPYRGAPNSGGRAPKLQAYDEASLLRTIEFKLRASNLVELSRDLIVSGADLLGASNDLRISAAKHLGSSTLDSTNPTSDSDDDELGALMRDQSSMRALKSSSALADNRERHFRAPSTSDSLGATNQAPMSHPVDLAELEMFASNVGGHFGSVRRGSNYSGGQTGQRGASNNSHRGAIDARQQQYELSITLAALLGTALLSTMTFVLVVIILCQRKRFPFMADSRLNQNTRNPLNGNIELNAKAKNYSPKRRHRNSLERTHEFDTPNSCMMMLNDETTFSESNNQLMNTNTTTNAFDQLEFSRSRIVEFISENNIDNYGNINPQLIQLPPPEMDLLAPPKLGTQTSLNSSVSASSTPTLVYFVG